jgi:FkbM family methyltransferase
MHTFDESSKLTRKVFDEISRKKDEIYIWGGSPYVPRLIDSLKTEFGVTPKGIFDTRRTLISSEFPDIQILKSSDLPRFSHDTTLLIVAPGLNELYGDIVPQEFFYFTTIHRRAIEAAIFFGRFENSLTSNLDLLADNESTRIYTRRIELLLRGVMFDFSIKSAGGPYFCNDVFEKPPKSWLYGGLFNGVHFERARFLSKPHKISLTGIEPSKHWFKYLTEKFKNDSEIELINGLLWDRRGENVDFVDDLTHNGLAASVEAHESFGARYKVETNTIDDIMKDRQASLVSLDIEGAEQRALVGGMNFFLAQRPDISVCIYHSFDDYLKIPKTLSQINSSPVFIRQHSCIPLIETVAYVKGSGE